MSASYTDSARSSAGRDAVRCANLEGKAGPIGHSTEERPMLNLSLLRRTPRSTRRRPFLQAHPMTLPEAGTVGVRRLDHLVPSGSVTRAPAQGRPHPTPIRNRLWAGETEEAASA